MNFVDNRDKFDIIFIDGMHQADFVLRDFNNSIDCLINGFIFLDDVLPLNEREQHKISIKHVYENGILKYREFGQVMFGNLYTTINKS